MLITQRIRDILGGVSQEPVPLRSDAVAALQENTWSSLTRGLRKRPPTKHVAQLSAAAWSPSSTFVRVVGPTPAERDVLVVTGGAATVYDATTGAARPVYTPAGSAYLAGAGPFRATTVGDTTVLANTATAVKLGPSVAAPQAYEALLFVRQADYSTLYSVTLGGSTVTIKTMDDAAAGGRAAITTDAIAADLVAALLRDQQVADDYTLTQLGSTVWVRRKDAKDFTLSAADGLADKGLRAIKGSVQTAEDLPERAPDGMVLRVAGDAGTAQDDYWVRYDISDTSDAAGVWRECPAPGSSLGLDAATLPWGIVRNGSFIPRTVVQSGAPALPTVARGVEATYTEGFSSDPNTGNPRDPFADTLLQAHNDAATGILASATGDTRTLNVAYDIDTTVMEPGTGVEVKLSANTGSGLTPVASKMYNYGVSLRDEVIGAELALPANTTVEARVLYWRKNTPAPYRQAFVTLHKADHSRVPGIVGRVAVTRRVAFDAAAVYPEGTAVTLTITPPGGAATPFTYTVTGGDGTGASVATALIPLVDANAALTATADGSGALLVGSVAPGPRVMTQVALDATKVFWSPELAMTPGEHVGRTLTNLTDGSSGTITSNGATWLACSAGLSGGARNRFEPGDTAAVYGTGTYYIVGPLAWDGRQAGDERTAPTPGLVGRAVADVGYFQGRLVLVAGDRVLLSEADHLFNFYRTTVTDLLASDPIEVTSTSPDGGRYQSVAVWDQGLWLLGSGGQQDRLAGNPVVTPTTVTIERLVTVPSAVTTVPPLGLGKFLVFPRTLGESVRIMAGTINEYGRYDAPDITSHVPEYLTGTPLGMAGDGGTRMVCVLTTTGLWVATVREPPSGRTIDLAGAWSTWTFAGGTPVGLDMRDGVLTLVMARGAEGTFLETLDVGTPPDPASDHRDRQGFTTPVAYTMRHQFSPFFYRDSNGAAMTQGRLQVRYLTIHYHDAKDFSVAVTPTGRPTRTTAFTSAVAAAGALRVPVLSRNTDAMVEITSSAPTGCAFSGVDWEATYDVRSRPA